MKKLFYIFAFVLLGQALPTVAQTQTDDDLNQLKHQTFTSPWYAGGNEGTNELERRGWKPANRTEQILFTLAGQNNIRSTELEPCPCDILGKLFKDTTYVKIRGELIDALLTCCGKEVVPYAVEMLPTLAIDSDNNWIVNRSVMQALIAHRSIASSAMPVLIGRIRQGDVGALWVVLLGGRFSRQALEACLAYNGTNGYLLDKTRTALDDYSQEFTTRRILTPALAEIPDVQSRQLVWLLVQSRQHEIKDGEYALTDSELHSLVQNNALAIRQSVQASLEGVGPSSLAVLDALPKALLIPYCQLLVNTHTAYTGAGGNLQGLTMLFRTIELANRSPRIKQLVRHGDLFFETEYTISFPWDVAHYGPKDRGDIKIQMPQIK